MIRDLPNLELVVWKAKSLLAQNTEFLQRIIDNRIDTTEFDVLLFPQWWDTTATGFDDYQQCHQVMTKEYTTVVHEIATNSYVVCFGEETCYLVIDPNKEFLEDLEQHKLAAIGTAQYRYSEDKHEL